MRAVRALAALALPAVFGVALTTQRIVAQEGPDIDVLLARVGERIAEFYRRAQRVVCLETSTVQPIDRSFSLAGFARTVESELRVETDPSGEATVVRHVLQVNGRPPRERDQTDRAGCTDPTPLSTAPLTFLLPPHQSAYEFRFAGFGTHGNRAVFLIDFATVNRRSDAELIEDEAGHDDCFDWSGHVASRGRIWVDEQRYDVVRVDRSLRGPLDVRVPVSLQRSHNFERFVVIEREDTSTRFGTVAFSDPDELLLLPESVHALLIARSHLQSTRRSQIFSNCRRFVTTAEIVE